MHALVTGANGHLGFNLVQRLLQQGHRVRGSLRGPLDGPDAARLRALGPVELVRADIRDAAAMGAALQGVDRLFHVAAVYSVADRSRDADMIDAAVRGTGTVLRAAAAAGVRRVVMTSSVVTLPLKAPGEPPATEDEWTTDLRVPYFRAKVESERLAWALADELGLELATVLPASIIGPGFARSTPTLDILRAGLMGVFRLGVPAGNLSMVDVRDTAQAHILAAERGARGRFIVANDHSPSYDEIARALGRIDPRVKPPLMRMPLFASPLLPLYDRLSHRLLGTPRVATPEAIATTVSGRLYHPSNRRAREGLGWRPEVPFEQSLRDTVQALQALPALRR